MFLCPVRSHPSTSNKSPIALEVPKMRFVLQVLSFLLLPFVSIANFLGPIFPAPTDLTSDGSLVAKAWKNLTTTLDADLKNLDGLQANVTFSFGLLSIHDTAAAKFQYHHTSPDIANAVAGTKIVDGDSIYKVASVSKLITVFAGLLTLTNEDWNRPLTDVIPGLAKGINTTTTISDDPIYQTQWDQITPWALATHLAGIPQLGLPSGDLLFTYETIAAINKTKAAKLDPVTTYGFPPQNLSILGPCSNISDPFCPVDDFIASIRDIPPSFLPCTTPAYSDEGLMLLGLAISRIINKPISEVYNSSIFSPLNMSSTLSTVPNTPALLSRSVIPGDPTLTGFNIDGKLTIPSGGLFSTINDLAKFGIGILNSTLLSPSQTRKWMKPVTHTSSLTYSVGVPWEIIRWIDPTDNSITDLYTKLGDSGAFGGASVLIPDYGAGFSFLGAHSNGSLKSSVDNLILDKITETVLPALKAQAAAEAQRKFVGTYVSTDPNLNSSVTIGISEEGSTPSSRGLIITSWISNGTNVLATDALAGPLGDSTSSGVGGAGTGGSGGAGGSGGVGGSGAGDSTSGGATGGAGTTPGSNNTTSPPNTDTTTSSKSYPRLLPSISNRPAGQFAFQATLNAQSSAYTDPLSSSNHPGPFTSSYATNFDWQTAGSKAYAGLGTNLFVFSLNDDTGEAESVSPAVARVRLVRQR